MGAATRRRKSLRIGVHHANAVVWEPVYRTHRDATLGDALDVVAQTAPTPALPYITSLTQDAEALFAAISTALSTLDSPTQDALGLKALVTLPSQDYLAVATPKPPQI